LQWNANESTFSVNLRRHHQYNHHYDRQVSPPRCSEPITISSPFATFTSHSGVDLNTFSIMAGKPHHIFAAVAVYLVVIDDDGDNVELRKIPTLELMFLISFFFFFLHKLLLPSPPSLP